MESTGDENEKCIYNETCIRENILLSQPLKNVIAIK